MDHDAEWLGDLLAKHASGTLASHERDALERWVVADPAGRRRVFLDALPSALALTRDKSDVSRPWAMPSGGVRGAAWGASRAVRVAAAVIVLIGGAGVWRVVRQIAHLHASSVMHTYATGAGQRATVTLGDGTQVTLAPASRVRIAGAYGLVRRDVDLEGEAYFAVAHDGRHPFVVHTRNATAEDLGTRFIVRSYPEEPVVRVVVTDGRVSLGDTVRSSRGRSVLPSGTLGEVDRTGVTHVTTGVNVDDYVGWTRGELRFVRMPLRDVLAELGRWYDLDVRTDDPALGARPVTASFPATSADTVFTTIAAAFGVHWRRTGRVVALTGRSE